MAKKSLNYNQSRALGSLLLQQLNNQKPAPSKTRQETPAEEFARLAREEQENFVQVSRPATAYEKAIDGRDTVTISVPRKQYEDKYGITALKTAWRQDSVEIQALSSTPTGRVKLIDSMAGFPMSSTPVEMTSEQADQIAQRGMEFLASKNLSEADRHKVVLYASIHIESNSLLNAADPSIWQIAFDRLHSLGCITTQPQSRAQATTAEPSADEMQATAENDWFNNQVGPLWGSFKAYLAQKFNFFPNEKQQRAFLDFIVKHGLQVLDHESFNIARRALVKSGVIPAHCLLADELLADRVENGEFRLDTDSGRRAYQIEKNRLIYSESD